MCALVRFSFMIRPHCAKKRRGQVEEETRGLVGRYGLVVSDSGGDLLEEAMHAPQLFPDSWFITTPDQAELD